MGPETGAHLVRYQCHLRASAVHSSCNQDLRGKAAKLIWDSQSQIRRHDRVRLAANPKVQKERVFTQTRSSGMRS